MSDLTPEAGRLLVAVAHATIGQGGGLSILGARVQWWEPNLWRWQVVDHETLESALGEAARRLGIEDAP